jgi:hypothetical protein
MLASQALYHLRHSTSPRILVSKEKKKSQYYELEDENASVKTLPLSQVLMAHTSDPSYLRD